MAARLSLWLILVVVMAHLAPHAAAQEAGSGGEDIRVVHLEALNVADEYWFKVKGKSAENPELGFLPGETIEIHLDSKGHVPHNLHIGPPIDRGLPLLEPGETEVLRFRVPADATGSTTYWCEPHRDLGMVGNVVFDERKAGPALQIPAPALPHVLVLVGLCLLLGFSRRGSPSDR